MPRPYVATLTEKRKVIRFMVKVHEQCGGEDLASKVVRRFPQIFKGNVKSQERKAWRWWQIRDAILEAPRPRTKLVKQHGLLKRVERKVARPGRGRKRPEWKTWLFMTLYDEFTRLKKSGIDFSASSLVELASHIIANNDSEFSESFRDPVDGIKIVDKLNTRLMYSFCRQFNILLRDEVSRSRAAEDKANLVRASVAVHLGRMHRSFSAREVHPSQVYNMDEMHLTMDRTSLDYLGLRDDQLELSQMVQGGESMTIVLLISGGNMGRIHTPLLVFSDRSRRHPIPDLLDNHPDVTYRSQPNGWIDGEVFAEWLAEDRVFPRHVGYARHVFLDNCSSHNTTQRVNEILQMKNIQLHYLPPNSISLCQPLDSGLIKTIRDVWKRQWNEKKDEFMHQQGLRAITTRSRAWRGNLDNSKKTFFLQLASSVINEVNSMRSGNGLSLAHQSVLQCGLGLNENHIWNKTMLIPKLQDVIDAHPAEFHGSQSSG